MKLNGLLKIDRRLDNNIMCFYDKYIIYFLNKKIYNIKWYLYNYFYFLDNGLNTPKLLSYSYEYNYYMQEKIININTPVIYKKNYLNILTAMDLFYKDNYIEIKTISSIKTIIHSFYEINRCSNIGDFLINFLDFIFIKSCNESHKHAYLIIRNKILENKKYFKDKNVYFIHGDLKEKNILINKEGIIYFIDFENSGWFDYYYDYATLYLENKDLFLKKIPNIKIINKKRLEVNIDIYNFLNEVYNKNTDKKRNIR